MANLTSTNQLEGWSYLINATKWHYFKADGKSLCGRWLILGGKREQGNDDSADNCKACRRKLDKHQCAK
jgi:hypothetical protein